MPSSYTSERIKQGIDYATRRLDSATRKPSSILEKLLIIYRNSCLDYLESVCSAPDRSTELLSEIRGYETRLSDKQWAATIPDKSTQELQDELLKLRQLQFYSRYGDYFKQVAHRLRTDSRERETANWELLSGQYIWSDIRSRVIREENPWKEHGSRYPDKVKTTYAIWSCSESTGLNFDQLILAVDAYGARNEAMHNSLEVYLSEGRYTDIAVLLHQDLGDLSSTIPANLQDREEGYRAILLQLRDEWFYINPGNDEDEDDFDTPRLWRPTDKLYLLMKAAKNLQKKAQAIAVHQEDVARGAKRLIEKADEEEALVKQLQTKLSPNTMPEPGPLPTGKAGKSAAEKSKRKASQDLKGPDRKKAWTTFESVRSKAVATFHQSLQTMREANRVVSDYTENWNSPPPTSPRSSSAGPSSSSRP